MATNSSTAGYLAPLAPAPAYDDQLADLLHDAIQGITGIADGSLIRPRWQPEPPNQPDFSTDWVAFGVTAVDADRFAYQGHDPTGDGANELERDEVVRVLTSFYGPNAMAVLQRYRDGLQVAQNRDALASAGIKLLEVQEATVLPALLKEKWVNRVDCAVVFRRRVKRVYPVFNLQSAGVDLDNEQYTTPITTTTP
jgi:hypothetical protein